MTLPHDSPKALKRSLLTVALLYFLMYMGTGVMFTFFAVYLRTKGLSGGQIGLINMTGSLVSIFASTFWGYLSDLTGKPKILLAVAASGTAAIAMLYRFAHSFQLFLVLGAFFAFFNFAIMTLMDSNLLTLLGDNRADYGKYRLGGTFGYILTTALSGFLLPGDKLSAIFPVYAVIMVSFILTALTLPPIKARTGKIQLSFTSIGALLKVPGWNIFLPSVLLVWIAGSGAMSFVSITLQSMGAENSLIGVVASAAAIFEIPFMIYSSYFMRRLGSLGVFHISLVGYLLRTTGYSLMPSPEWGIAVNALNGISYVWMWNSSITYINETAPEHLKATAQGFFNSITAFAALVSAPLAGTLFDTIGPQPMYLVLAAIALVGLVIFTLNRHKLPDPRKLQERTLT